MTWGKPGALLKIFPLDNFIMSITICLYPIELAVVCKTMALGLVQVLFGNKEILEIPTGRKFISVTDLM